MQFQGLIEFGVLIDIDEPTVAAHVVGEFSAKEISEIPPNETRKELVRQDAELGWGGKASDSSLDVLGGGLEKAGGPLCNQSSQALRGGHLSHLAQIGSPTSIPEVGIHGVVESTYDFQQKGPVRYLEPQIPEPARKPSLFSRKGDLGEEPHAVDQSCVFSRPRHTRPGGLHRRSGNLWCTSPRPDKVDYLDPSSCSRQVSEPDVPHFYTPIKDLGWDAALMR